MSNERVDYDLASETYDNTRKPSELLVARFADRVALTAETTILDFGCGTGNYLNSIQTTFGARCCGVEPSDKMRAIASDKNKSVDVRRGDHRNIPFDAGKFDFVYMTDVIPHVPERDVMLSELWRVSKAGCFLCVVTESHEQIQRRFYNDYFPSLAANEHRRYPKIQAIVESSARAGFTHEDTEVIATSTATTITERFLTNVEEKNYSMFRLLDENEFVEGLSKLKVNKGKTFDSCCGGESLIWLRKGI